MYRQRSPMCHAAYCGNSEDLRNLMRVDTDVNKKDGQYEDRPLTLAAFKGHLGVVKLLMHNGADVEATNNQGDTPLMLAAMNGNYTVVKYLVLRCHAKVDARNKKGITPTIQAFRHGYVDIGKFFWQHGGSLEEVDIYNNSAAKYCALDGSHHALKYLVENGIDVNQVNRYGDSLIYGAVEGGHVQIVEYLASKNADLNIKNKFDTTPLMHSIRKGRKDIVQYLLSKNVNINEQNKKGDSCLHISVRNKLTELTEILLVNGADTGLINILGETPLDIAIQLQNNELVELLKLNHERQNQLKRLYNACQFGHLIEAHKILNDAVGVNVNGRIRNRDPALILACNSQNVRLCAMLIEEGANIDTQNDTGDTALHVAVRTGNRKLVSELLKHSPRLLPNNNGVTPEELARGYTKIINEMLTTYAASFPTVTGGNRLEGSDVAAERHNEIMTQLQQLNEDVVLNSGKPAKLKLKCKQPVLRQFQEQLQEHMAVDTDLLHSLQVSLHLSVVTIKAIQKEEDQQGRVNLVLYEVNKHEEQGVLALVNALGHSNEGNRALAGVLQQEIMKSPKRRKMSN